MGRTAGILVLGSLLMVQGLAHPGTVLAEQDGGRVYFLQAGPSFLTQDVAGDIEANMGPMVRLGGLYRVNERVALGIAADWERHGVEGNGTDLGNLMIVTPTVVVEVGFPEVQPVIPYLSGALGANINLFDESSSLNAACRSAFGGRCDFDPDHTFAARIAAGADFFLSPTLSLNGEIGWKYNSGDMDFRIGGGDATTLDFDANVFFLLLGTRFSTGGS